MAQAVSTQRAIEHDEHRHPRVIGRALCQFPDGQSRVLYLTRLGSDSADILCAMPPPLGSPVSVIFELERGDPLLPISARVSSIVPDAVTGLVRAFTVVFAKMSSAALRALDGVAADESPQETAVVARKREHRRDRRVWIDAPLVASVASAAGVRGAQVATLSLSGALVAFNASDDLHDLPAGTAVTLDIVLRSVPEVISVQARVVRRTGPSEPYGLGVRFVDLDRTTQARIEGVLMYVLGQWPARRGAR
ncbi:MAG: PilZ domain-containing protein [Polyangiaceae bacterium]|nr:PilZ domain-containing protein [Polyangiaceae bacterium]